MTATPEASDISSIAELRARHYNATVVGLRYVNPELVVLRVRPDRGILPFQPGQYTTLGLGYWEPRAPGTQREQLVDRDRRRLVLRAYSIGCSLWSEERQLITVADVDYLEFYVVLIREAGDSPPALTPRLFLLQPGDRLFVGPKITGRFTLAGVAPDDDILLLGTGTGEAPHNAMAAELLRRGHAGRILNVTCVRSQRDLGYVREHRALEARYPQYAYHFLTTREPINLDPAAPGYVGKCYLQDLLTSGRIDALLGHPLDPQRAHVFLCGSPAMIGVPTLNAEGGRVYPQPTGVIELLEQRGFQADPRGAAGRIHFEKYW